MVHDLAHQAVTTDRAQVTTIETHRAIVAHQKIALRTKFDRLIRFAFGVDSEDALGQIRFDQYPAVDENPAVLELNAVMWQRDYAFDRKIVIIVVSEKDQIAPAITTNQSQPAMGDVAFPWLERRKHALARNHHRTDSVTAEHKKADDGPQRQTEQHCPFSWPHPVSGFCFAHYGKLSAGCLAD